MTVAAIGPVRECDADFLKELNELWYLKFQ